MAYVKLDTGVLDSTLWTDRDGREVFLTALLMATPHEVTTPTPALHVRSLEASGFVVPPGWYGKVAAAGVGIARRAGIDVEAGLDALERLCAPDPESRTPDHEGRRLVRVDGGYLILNFMVYRDRDTTAAERQQRYRERHKNKPRNGVTVTGNGVTSRNITQEEEEEVSSKQEALRNEEDDASSSVASHLTDERQRDAYLSYYNAHRRKDGMDAAVRDAAKQYGWPAVGLALVDMRAADADFTARRLMGFAKKARPAQASYAAGHANLPTPAGFACEHCGGRDVVNKRGIVTGRTHAEGCVNA